MYYNTIKLKPTLVTCCAVFSTERLSFGIEFSFNCSLVL